MKDFWEGFEKKAIFNVKVPDPLLKDIGEAAGHINRGTAAGEELVKRLASVLPRMERRARHTSDKALKYLKRGGLGALGIYGAGKAMEAPANLERYQYYKDARKLTKKQMKKLDEEQK